MTRKSPSPAPPLPHVYPSYSRSKMSKYDQDIEYAAQPDPYSPDDKPILEPVLNVGGHGATQRRLQDYHVTMIGFCSGIGTGLFIGTGSAYANAGPAGLLLAYIIVGSVLWCVMQSVAELATVVSKPLVCRCMVLTMNRFQQLDRSLTSQHVLLIPQSASPWLSVTVIATPYPSRPRHQHQPSSSATGPT